MEAKKIDYLKDIFYIYGDEWNQIATVHTDTGIIIWEGGEEPYRGAAHEVRVEVAEEMYPDSENRVQ